MVDVGRVQKQRFAMDRKFIEIHLESVRNLPRHMNPSNLNARVCVVHHPAFVEGAPSMLVEELLSDLRASEDKLSYGQRLDWKKFPSRAGAVRNQALWDLRAQQLYVEPPKNLGVDPELDLEGDDDVGVIVNLRSKGLRALRSATKIAKKLSPKRSSRPFAESPKRKENEQACWFLLPLRELCNGRREWPIALGDRHSPPMPTLYFSAKKTLLQLSAAEVDANLGSIRDVMCNVKIEDCVEVLHVNSILRLVNQSSLALQGMFEMPVEESTTPGKESTAFAFGIGACQFAPLHMIPSGSVKLFLRGSTQHEMVFEGQLHKLLSEDRQTLHFQHEGQHLYLSMSRICCESGEWTVSINAPVLFYNLLPVPITVWSGAFVLRRDDGWLTELKKLSYIDHEKFSSFSPPRQVRNGTIVRVLRQIGEPPSVFVEVEVISEPEISGFIRAKHLCEQDNGDGATPHHELTLEPGQTASCIAWSREMLEQGKVAVRVRLHEVFSKVKTSGRLWTRATTIPFANASHNEAEVAEHVKDDVARGELHLVEKGRVFSIIAETDGNMSSQTCTVRLFAPCWVVNRSGMKLSYRDDCDAVSLKNVVSPTGYADVDTDALVPVSLFSHRKQLQLYDSVSDVEQGITMAVQCKPKPVRATEDLFMANGSTYVVQSHDGDEFIGL